MKVGAHGVDDPGGRQVEAGSGHGAADRQTVGQLGVAYLLAGIEQAGAGCAVDGAVDSSSTQEGAVGGVDDGIDLLGGDVTDDGLNAHGSSLSAAGARQVISACSVLHLLGTFSGVMGPRMRGPGR